MSWLVELSTLHVLVPGICGLHVLVSGICVLHVLVSGICGLHVLVSGVCGLHVLVSGICGLHVLVSGVYLVYVDSIAYCAMLVLFCVDVFLNLSSSRRPSYQGLDGISPRRVATGGGVWMILDLPKLSLASRTLQNKAFSNWLPSSWPNTSTSNDTVNSTSLLL